MCAVQSHTRPAGEVGGLLLGLCGQPLEIHVARCLPIEAKAICQTCGVPSDAGIHSPIWTVMVTVHMSRVQYCNQPREQDA